MDPQSSKRRPVLAYGEIVHEVLAYVLAATIFTTIVVILVRYGVAAWFGR